MRAPRKRPSTSAKVRCAPKRATICWEDTPTEREGLQATRKMLFAAGLAWLALASGCGQGGNDAAANGADAAPTGEQGYVAPPELTGATRIAGDRIELAGRASAGATVRLATPAGAAQFAASDPQGHWSLQTAITAEPRLFGLSMSSQGRVIQAAGYLFLAPDGALARLRAGGGSEVLAPTGAHLAATALDYDAQRAATLSGRAAAGETVNLRVDGVERGQAEADTRGRFVLPVHEPLAAGAHDFDLAAQSGQAHLSAVIEAPAALGGAPFQARRIAAGWRIDWLTPGGGEQTTLILDVPEPPH